jgi:hypothetical protein
MKRIIPILLILSASSLLSAQHDLKPSKPKIIRQWHLSEDYTEEITMPFDTVFSLFHRFRIADRQSPVNAYLGNHRS